MIGPLEKIILPPQSRQVEHEAELVVVISRRGRWIQPDNAMAHVLGYTIGNDITAVTCSTRMTSGPVRRASTLLLPSDPGSKLSSTQPMP